MSIKFSISWPAALSRSPLFTVCSDVVLLGSQILPIVAKGAQCDGSQGSSTGLCILRKVAAFFAFRKLCFVLGILGEKIGVKETKQNKMEAKCW